MSRRSWYRRNKLRTGTVGTTSSAALLSYVPDDESVPPATKAPAAYGGGGDGFGSLDENLRLAALGLLNHAESAWDRFSKAA
jgi:hypothetical protein